MFLARLLAYGVVVGDVDGCGRDIFRFLYIARDKPGDKQNAATAPPRSQIPPSLKTASSARPSRRRQWQSKGGEEGGETHTIMRRFEFECHLAVAVRID